MKEIKDVLNMSNTAIKKLKKGELENAVIKLKAMYSNSVSNGNTEAMGIELHDKKERNEADVMIISKLQTAITALKSENAVIARKGANKAATIARLNNDLESCYAKIDRMNNRSFIARLFN